MSKSNEVLENFEKNLKNTPGITLLSSESITGEEVELVPLFPSILLMRKVPDFFEIQKDLLSWIYKYKERYPTGITESNIGGWQSSTDIFEHKSFLTYGSILSNEVTIMLDSILKPKKVNLSSGWISINPPNSFNKSHTHPNSDVSGLLVVKNNLNSANIEFEHPHSFGQSKLLSSLKEDISDGLFSKTLKSFKLNEGDLLIFPSSLRCSISSNLSDDDFVSVWFSLDIKYDL